MKSFRVGKFAVVLEWNRYRVGWAIHKWRYGGRESWWHGTAYLGPLRIIW